MIAFIVKRQGDIVCFGVDDINNNQNSYDWVHLKGWREKDKGMMLTRKYHSYDKWQNNYVKPIRELIFKTPVVMGRIYVALLTAVCGFSSIPQHERRADVAQSTSLPTWHQSILWHGRLHALKICLKSLQAAQINWSAERNATVNISALTETSFKAVLTQLCDFRGDHPISKIHNQELLLSCSSLTLSFCVYWPFEMPLFQFQWKLLLHLNLSYISSLPEKRKKK